MTQERFDHQLNEDWSLAGGVQLLDGQLAGNAVEANALQADGRTLLTGLEYEDYD